MKPDYDILDEAELILLEAQAAYLERRVVVKQAELAVLRLENGRLRLCCTLRDILKMRSGA